MEHSVDGAKVASARWRGRTIKEVIETTERLFGALTRVADDKRLVAARERLNDGRVLDRVIQPATIPAYFKCQGPADRIIYAEYALVLAVRLDSRCNAG